MHKLVTSFCALLGLLVLACGAGAAESTALPTFDYKAHCKDFAKKHGGFEYLEKLCLEGEERNINYFQKKSIIVSPDALQQCVDDSKAYGQSYLFLGSCLQSKGMKTQTVATTPAKPTAESSAANDIPEYNIATYCKKTAELMDGSAVMEKTCRNQEDRAKKKLISFQYSQRVMEYCKRNIKTLDLESYTFLETCIRQEMKAEKELGR